MKPKLYYIPSFDSSKGTTIKFSWLGNQPFSNTIVIRNNDTNAIVYEKTLSTLRFEHAIPSNSGLVNGTLYNVSVKVTDGNGTSSEWSDIQLFYCYSTPTFEINITPGQIIQAQTYGLSITYSQPEGELLQSYRVRVFNPSDSVIYDSDTRYFLDTVKITNLQDNGHYYIIVTGETVNGMALSTDKISFTADFVKSEAYFMCELQNMYDTGGIYIKSNIVFIEAYSDTDIKYIDNDIADLTNNVVHFNKGFTISGDFTLLIRGYGFEEGARIAQFSGGDEIITIEYKRCPATGVYYFELVATYKKNKYFITQDNPYHNQEISLYIHRKDSLLGLEVMQ